MHLRYYINEKGERVYTLKTVLDDGSYTFNAHPGSLIILSFSLMIFLIFQQDLARTINIKKKDMRINKDIICCLHNSLHINSEKCLNYLSILKTN